MFRTAYINQPYFRESYFSILNRYKDHLGLNGSNASRHLFGEVIRKFNPNQALNVDLFIKRICQNSFLNNANTIIENHTLIPYLRPFVSQSELNQIIQLMKGSFINPPLIKTLSTPQKALRYCPICVKSDRVKYQETYWHLMHSIPGWSLCPEHNCYLHELDHSKISNKTIWYVADNLVRDNMPIVYGNQVEKSVNADIQSILLGNNQFDRMSILDNLKNAGFVKNNLFVQIFRQEITRILSSDSHLNMIEIKSFNKAANFNRLINGWSPTLPIYLLVLKYYQRQLESSIKIIPQQKELNIQNDCRCGESKCNLLTRFKKGRGNRKDWLEIFCPVCGYRYNINILNESFVIDYGFKIVNQIKAAREDGKLYREISAELMINIEMIKKLSKIRNYKSYQEKFERNLSVKRKQYLTCKKQSTKYRVLENWLRKYDSEWFKYNKIYFKRKKYTTIKVSDVAILNQLKKRFNQLCKENPNYRISKIKLLGDEFKDLTYANYQKLLPKTVSFINGSVESWLSFKTRQISQFVESVCKTSGYLKDISERSLYHRFIGNRKSLTTTDVISLKCFVKDYLESYQNMSLAKI
jgi:hypothetical protein